MTNSTLESGFERVDKPGWKRSLPIIVIFLIVISAVVRSSITTSLDSFTYDEAYHIGAGVAYVETGDFRLNPEHPPLVKLWVGAYVKMLGYKLSPFRSFADKEDERDWVEKDAYFANDPLLLQARSRTAMLALNAVLMLLFAGAIWRSFGSMVAIGVTLYLAIDPTVAAHMPVVMTDLPIALTSGTAILSSVRAFQTWRIVDAVVAAVALGLALATKHSGIVVLIAVGIIGAVFLLFSLRSATWRVRSQMAGLVAAIVLGGVVILWAFYGFRYAETPGVSEETFNRPLSAKAADIRSPAFRNAVIISNELHIFPRAYTWGMADTIRAGIEGRAIEVLALGQLYFAKGPWYVFPVILAAKLPIGLLLLSFMGIGLLALRRLPAEFVPPVLAYAGFALLVLVFLIRGSSYAGIRHAMPLIPFLALFGGIAIFYAVSRSKPWYRILTAGLTLFAIVSAVPQMRPWEYFNEVAGGAENGSRYFKDEGVDLSQRIGEAATFYHTELEPKGELPLLIYFSNSNDRKARGMDYIGRDDERDEHRLDDDLVTGTFMIGSNELGRSMWWDVGEQFRGVEPTKRFGNLFIFQGTFRRPVAVVARHLFYKTIYSSIYTSTPDPRAAIEGIERSISLDNSCFFAYLELGNQYLAVRDREKALEAYRHSMEKVSTSDSVSEMISTQIRRLESDEALENISPLRNPGIE